MTEAYLIARADGPGTNRFIGRALLDPLHHGCDLLRIELRVIDSRTAIEFHFGRDAGAITELIRCFVDPGSEAGACEIWRLVDSPTPSQE